MNSGKKYNRILLGILWGFVVLASIKSILIDTGYDNAYTMLMAYRHINGDGMFAQMWEPHQSSMFVTEFFMRLYKLFVPNYTGVMIYLQVMGTMLWGILGIVLYRFLKPCIGNELSQLAAIFFIMFRVKQSPFPEYANLQIAFSLLLWIFLSYFIRNQKKVWLLCTAAVAMVLETLAYPACVLVYPAVVVVLALYTEKKGRNIGIVTGICGLLGGAYVCYFGFKIGWSRFVTNVEHIFFSDSHSEGAFVTKSYSLHYFLRALVWLAVCAGLAYLIHWLVRKWRNKSNYLFILGMAMFVSEFVMLLIWKKVNIDWSDIFYVIPTVLFVISIFSCKNLNQDERKVYVAGILIALVSFTAAAVLSDLDIVTKLAYFVLGGVAAFIPLSRRKEQVFTFLLMICALVTMHRGLVLFGYPQEEGYTLVWEVNALVRNGPCMGIICNDACTYRNRQDPFDHAAYIREDDAVFIVGGWMIDPMEYMMIPGKIANSSTITNQIFNKYTTDYFEFYPEKEPTVVVVTANNGKLGVDEDSWIMNWVNENYYTVGEGTFWRYYRRKQ